MMKKLENNGTGKLENVFAEYSGLGFLYENQA